MKWFWHEISSCDSNLSFIFNIDINEQGLRQDTVGTTAWIFCEACLKHHGPSLRFWPPLTFFDLLWPSVTFFDLPWPSFTSVNFHWDEFDEWFWTDEQGCILGLYMLVAAKINVIFVLFQCPDPGCKTSNPCSQLTCSNCNLPKHSANQFKRGESKILKQL